MYSVSTWLTSNPPTMEMPSGRRISVPSPVASASGSAPAMAAQVVIMMGRKRSRQARVMAARASMFCSRCAVMAKSIIMMAFFFTMPTSSRMPMKAISENSMLVASSASNAPTPAEGSVEMMVSGWK